MKDLDKHTLYKVTLIVCMVSFLQDAIIVLTKALDTESLQVVALGVMKLPIVVLAILVLMVKRYD